MKIGLCNNCGDDEDNLDKWDICGKCRTRQMLAEQEEDEEMFNEEMSEIGGRER